MRRRRQPQGDNFMLLLFLGQLWQQIERLPVKPVITLSVLAVMICAHVEPALLSPLNQPIEALCLSSQYILSSLQSGDLVNVVLRYFGSSLIHGSNHHLYYNSASFLLKGASLETQLGPGPFAVLLISLLLISNTIFVLLAPTLQPLFASFAPATDCAFGFSGILFALKYYIYNSHHGDVRLSLMFGIGFTVASKWATWVELLIVNFIAPHTSFFGHLCGIAAGAIAAHTNLVPIHLIWLSLEQAIRGGGTTARHEANNGASRASTTRYTYTAEATGKRAESDAQRRARLDEARNRRWRNLSNEID
tara:strand:+ start:474 stop:1391 length:918 start_codon:yes stop_codon:yes gene_type:complete